VAVDVRQLPRNDQAVIGLGILIFIASFFPWYGYSVHAGGFNASDSISSWHSWATIALLLLIAATALAAVQVFTGASLPKTAVSWNVVVLGLAALGTLLYIIRSFTLDTASGVGGSVGLKWGAYAVMILALLQTVFAFLRVREAGDAMPWENRGGTTTAPPPPPPPPGA
jgi:hypothetical protein